MNTGIRHWTVALAATALYVAIGTASAFYDPGLQRWINREPLQEPGFKRLTRRYGYPDENYYRFTRNQPTTYVDGLGLETRGQKLGCFLCGVSPSRAEQAFRTGLGTADRIFPGRNSPENEAMRHCVASAVLATTDGCSGAQCVGDNREWYQTTFQHQGRRRRQQGVNNNKIGRECAGCRGPGASYNPGVTELAPPYGGGVMIVHPPPPSTGLASIESCCMAAIFSGDADMGN